MQDIDKAKQDAGEKARNQDYSRYEQVKKSQSYLLSEQQGAEDFDDTFEIKTCDLSKWLHGDAAEKAAFAQDLGAAFEEIGFAILINHGVDPALYIETEQSVVDFFETIPRPAREPYMARRQGSVNQGYFPVRETTIIHPDLVEGWVFCRRALDLDANPDYRAENFWPDVSFEPRFRKVVKAHEALILPIMQSVLTYLGCDPHLYDEKLRQTNFGFRLNYYPALEGDLKGATGGRMLGHEDVDLFTILPASSQPGLQALNRKNMKWVRINPPAGSIIINTGDYMQRITNDRLPSTTHRVAQPPQAQNRLEPRISFPMAVYVWEDEILEVLPGLGEPKYPPVPAEEFHTKITSKYYGDDYRDD
jgi:isopenicillin N synthase-like dioxygenase